MVDCHVAIGERLEEPIILHQEPISFRLNLTVDSKGAVCERAYKTHAQFPTIKVVVESGTHPIGGTEFKTVQVFTDDKRVFDEITHWILNGDGPGRKPTQICEHRGTCLEDRCLGVSSCPLLVGAS